MSNIDLSINYILYFLYIYRLYDDANNVGIREQRENWVIASEQRWRERERTGSGRALVFVPMLLKLVHISPVQLAR